jgi:hypothetical protein
LRQLSTIKPHRDFAANFEEVLARSNSNKVVQFRKRVAWSSASIAAGLALIVLVLHAIPATGPSSLKVAAKQGDSRAIEVAANVQQLGAGSSITGVEKLAQTNGQSVPRSDKAQAPQVKDVASKPESANLQTADKESINKKPPAVIAYALGKKPAVDSKQADIPLVAHNYALTRSGGTDEAVISRDMRADDDTTPQTRGEIAAVPASQVLKGASGGEVVALYNHGANPAEELGITTDEDGLYAIKL